MIMAYLYRKDRSPYWYIQYQDSNRKKHDKSTGVHFTFLGYSAVISELTGDQGCWGGMTRKSAGTLIYP